MTLFNVDQIDFQKVTPPNYSAKNFVKKGDLTWSETKELCYREMEQRYLEIFGNHVSRGKFALLKMHAINMSAAEAKSLEV
jgi:hypothetical protein